MRRRGVVAALTALLILILAGLLIGEGRLFRSPSGVSVNVLPQTGSPKTGGLQASSPNTSGGSVSLVDSRSPGAIVAARDLKPSDVVTGQVTITNAASPVSVSLSENAIIHTGPNGSGNLASQLRLSILDNTTAVKVYDGGAFDALPALTQICGASTTSKCSAWKKGEAHVFTFTVTFPASSGNTFQGTSASTELDWYASK